jgi:hypothetical protein
MAEPTDPQTQPDATPEPVVVEPVSAAEHVGVEPDVPEVDEAEVVDDVAEPVVVEPVTVEPVTAEPVVEAVPVAEVPREVVYVQAPTPPAPRHNRGFGVLISIIGAIVFALLYLGAAAIVFALTPGTEVESTFAAFVVSDAFWVPVGAYAVFAVIFALIVNRAAWWAHVVGSLFVALLTYAVSLGVLALLRNVVAMTPDQAAQLFAALASSALLLCVAALARESSLWFGLAIASRGRRVKERNATERALYEQSVAERRAEYERAHPSA